MKKSERYSKLKAERGVGISIDHFVQGTIEKKKLRFGDITKRIALPLSDGRTIIYCDPHKDIENVKAFWENRIHHVC